MRTSEFRAGVALVVTAGCHTWAERPVTRPAPTPAAHALSVTTKDGARRLTLEDAVVRPDSVVGFVVEAADRRGHGWKADKAISHRQRVAVAVADVGSLEEWSIDWLNTGVLLGAVAAIVVAAAIAARAYAMTLAN